MDADLSAEMVLGTDEHLPANDTENAKHLR
jgi:hypothetical protein